MNAPAVNGRVKLSWAQIAWGIATLGAVISAWYDLRSQITGVKSEMFVRVQAAEREHGQIWEAIHEVQARELESKRGEKR